jgi:hypothetical protein
VAGEELLTFIGPRTGKTHLTPCGLAFSPDNKSLATCWGDGHVRVWGEIARRWPEGPGR